MRSEGVTFPAPRPRSSTSLRSYTSVCQPAFRRSEAAKRPDIEPPITIARREDEEPFVLVIAKLLSVFPHFGEIRQAHQHDPEQRRSSDHQKRSSRPSGYLHELAEKPTGKRSRHVECGGSDGPCVPDLARIDPSLYDRHEPREQDPAHRQA